MDGNIDMYVSRKLFDNITNYKRKGINVPERIIELPKTNYEYMFVPFILCMNLCKRDIVLNLPSLRKLFIRIKVNTILFTPYR